MNKIFLGLIMFMGLLANGQKSFPVQTEHNVDIYTRLKLEGMEQLAIGQSSPVDYDATLAPSGYQYNGTSIPETNGSTTFANFNYQPFPTRVGLLTELGIWSSADVRLQVAYPTLMRIVVGPTTPYRNTEYKMIFPGQTCSGSALGLVRPVKDAGGSVTNKYVSTVYAQSIQVSADMNFGAKNRIYFIGDSNTEGSYLTTNIYTSGIVATDVYSFKIRDWLNSLGNDCRLIDKSIGGKSSTSYETFRKAGYLGLPEAPNMIFYNHGTNDIDAATYKSNLKTFINWAIAKWPNVRIVVLAPIPAQGTWPTGTGSGLDGTSRETLLAQIRTNGAAAVSEINLPNQVIFINCGLAWSVGDNTKYSDTEADGSHVHANAAGHTAWFNYIKTDITTNHSTFTKLGFGGLQAVLIVGMVIGMTTRRKKQAA